MLEKNYQLLKKDNSLFEWNKMIHKFSLDNHYGSHEIILLAA